MAVYVDNAGIPAAVRNGPVVHSSHWSHLFADTQQELHDFATGPLGLKRSYFQPGRPRGEGTPSPYWHYDVTAGKRQRAIQLGAVPVTWHQAIGIMHQRDACAARAETADQASHAAGLAFRRCDLVQAARLLRDAAAGDPSRASLWAERASRVHTAARVRAAEVAGPNDPRPLAEIVAARLEAAGITADDPDLLAIRRWNAERQQAAVAEQEVPGHETAEVAAEPALDAVREAGQ